MSRSKKKFGSHDNVDAKLINSILRSISAEPAFEYTFKNFFHPFVGDLIEKLNRKSLSGLLDAGFHEDLKRNADNNPAIQRDGSIDNFYRNFNYGEPEDSDQILVEGFPKEIDVSVGGPYANYNWELLFHVPLTIAVHLSKNQRFAEAQRWFHYIFDPTSSNGAEPAPNRYWKFLAFRQERGLTIDEIVTILSTPNHPRNEEAMKSLEAIQKNPFQPHVVARLRQVAYQYSVVMKYLDNLFAWGDSLFMQDTIESINEGTQLYVLAANILGERPQRIPTMGKIRAKSYRQLKNDLGPLGNALTAMENFFPLNGSIPGGVTEDPPALFGIGRTLYFCVPRNDNMLAYWDTVADRLYKIRHCMNIEGVVRQLALFDPPLDPGMLVRAAAAGIDVGSIVAGLNQPIGPMRCLFLIQKALELCGEVRGLGGALLSAIEKDDGERLALLRQSHEIKIQEMAREVRFLQWKQAQESTQTLLRSRASALERYRFYLRVLGQTPDDNAAPETLDIAATELREDNFDDIYSDLVGRYDKMVPTTDYPRFEAQQDGRLYLHKGEYAELNEHSDRAIVAKTSASGAEATAAVLSALPGFGIKVAFWGVGGETGIPVGEFFSNAGRAVSSGFNIWANIEEFEGAKASKTATYDRRAQDWILQANLAAMELTQIGRQIIGSLIAEQIAYRDYQNVQKQIEQSQEVDRFLNEKFSNEELYAWMQGELTRLYYEYYRFAFDTARKAERVMKHELMRPEVDASEYVKYNYWDGGRKGLLSGEALCLDLKRMEMAYHENNKREYELTKHISLRQLNPLALLTLRAIGKCEFHVPEWLLDLDCCGHYMRRIKQVSLSIPAVTGPLTSMNCTLALLRSSLRKSPSSADDYARQEGTEDARFVDYFGTIESIVTSSGDNDGGMFETNLHDERYLPFEGAGMISTWRLELPGEFRQFDYNTISDVVLHVRYTARQGGEPLKTAATDYLSGLFEASGTSELALMLSLNQDFPNEWHRFATASEVPSLPFSAVLSSKYFPYFTQGRRKEVTEIICKRLKTDGTLETITIAPSPIGEINDEGTSFNIDGLDKNAEYFVVLKYTAS